MAKKTSTSKYTVSSLSLELLISGGTEYVLEWKYKYTVSQVDKFEVQWEYYAGKVWLVETTTSVDPDTVISKKWRTTHTPPSTAKKMRVKVRPVSKTKSGKNTGTYFTSRWSKYLDVELDSTDVMATVDAPSVEVVSGKMNISLTNIDTTSETGVKTKYIEYDLYEENTKTHSYARITVVASAAIWPDVALSAGKSYKVRARTVRNISGVVSWRIDQNTGTIYGSYNKEVVVGYKKQKKTNKKTGKTTKEKVPITKTQLITDGYIYDTGAWSSYTDSYMGAPTTPTLKKVYADSETSIGVTFTHSDAANSSLKYVIEYANKREYFNVSGTNAITTQDLDSVSYPKGGTYLWTGLSSGDTYYFRMYAENDTGKSGYSAIKSCVIGSEPDPPTIWSSRSTVDKGESVTLYWVHNSEDGSSLEKSQVWLDGTTVAYSNTRDDDHKDDIFSVTINPQTYAKTDVVNTNGFSVQYQAADSDTTSDELLEYGWVDSPALPSAALPNIWSRCRVLYEDGMMVTTTPQKVITYSEADSTNGVVSAITAKWGLGTSASNVGTVSSFADISTAYKAATTSSRKYIWVRYIVSYANVTTTTTKNVYIGGQKAESGTTTLTWKVRTKGVYSGGSNGGYSEWSETKTIKINTAPNYTVGLFDTSGNKMTDITSLPAVIRCVPTTTVPIVSATLSVKLISSPYDDVVGYLDEMGSLVETTVGATIYSTTKTINGASQTITFDVTPLEMRIMTGGVYQFDITISHSTGSTYNGSLIGVSVDIEEDEYGLSCELEVDSGNFSAMLRPFAVAADEDGVISDDETNAVYPEGLYISVYRLDYDGSMTEIASNIQNGGKSWVTDTYPSLNTMRYRLVCTNENTGGIFYDDIEFEETFPDPTGIVLQWDEIQNNWEVGDFTDTSEEAVLSSGMCVVMYGNVDVTDKSKPDVNLVEYIGREHPVSYYGTQVGQTSSWKCEISAEDITTITKLRMLQRYMGDIHVREPSGSSYWAHVECSFDLKHTALTVPVTLSITRVEGVG